MGLKEFYWDTVQLRSKERAFLLSENKQRLLCMGRMYNVISPYILDYGRAPWKYLRLTREMVQNVISAVIFRLHIQDILLHIYESTLSSFYPSGKDRPTTNLIWRTWVWSCTASKINLFCRILYLFGSPKVSIFLNLFYLQINAYFHTDKYSTTQIPYNRNPVKAAQKAIQREGKLVIGDVHREKDRNMWKVINDKAR